MKDFLKQLWKHGIIWRLLWVLVFLGFGIYAAILDNPVGALLLGTGLGIELVETKDALERMTNDLKNETLFLRLLNVALCEQVEKAAKKKRKAKKK